MSGLEAALKIIADRIRNHGETIATEEAVKTSVILPFLQALGYDVFNPAEVIPEFTADAVGKKGEKVDYAIQLEGQVRLLVECKGLSTRLEARHLSQLYRYFSVTKAKFAILTNGRVFQFYTDLDEPNKLDARPFFVVDLLDAGAAAIAELQKFEKASFDVDRILATAERLKYVSAVKKFLSAQMEAPGDELVKVVAGEVHDGRLTAQVRDLVASATQTAFREIVRDAVRSRLSSALETASGDGDDAGAPEEDGQNAAPAVGQEIVTTQEEVEGMMTVRAIVRDILPGARVGLRDAKSYCAVLVDDNNRKPLARLHFNRKQWYLGLFDGDSETREPISGLDDIYVHADRLRAAAEKYREA